MHRLTASVGYSMVGGCDENIHMIEGTTTVTRTTTNKQGILRQVIFVDKKTGYLHSNRALTLQFLCKWHQHPIKKDFYCEKGKHKIMHPLPYELFEV